MRPINKETEAVELDQLFESYVETDLFHQLTTSVADPSGSDDLAHLFDLPSSNENDLFGFTPILHRESEPWHKATQLGSQNPSASSGSFSSSAAYSTSRGKSASSDSDTLSFEDLFELERNQLRSTSQPSTPRPTTATSTSTTARCIKKAQSFPDRSISRGVQKSLKKCPSSSFAKTAKMMQPSYYRAPVPHMWTRKMDSAVDLHAHVLPINMHSPPPSTKLGQDECADGFFVQHQHQQPYHTTRSPIVEDGSSPDMGFANYQLTPQASPALGVNNNGDPFSQNIGLAYSTAGATATLSAFTPPSSLRLPMTTWGPTDSPAMDFPFSSCSPDFATTKTAGWWNDDSMPMAQQPYPTHRESHARTTSQSIPISMAGLGISCDMSSFSDMSEYQSHPQPEMPSYHQPMYPTPPIHATHPHPENLVPIGTRPLSRSPSPTPQPRFHRRRPSGQAARSSATASRRKSSQSSHGSARAPSSAGASAGVGFVNFTPDDSRKILTGVAPSGSSKTKARREKEAAEKRRKLSQAAVKAVMEAGGDVERLKMLEREGLCVFES